MTLNPIIKRRCTEPNTLVARAGRYTITLFLTVLYLSLTVFCVPLTVLHMALTVLCPTLVFLYLALTVVYQYADGGDRIAEPERIPGRARRALHHHFIMLTV